MWMDAMASTEAESEKPAVKAGKKPGMAKRVVAQIKASTAFNRTPGIFLTAQHWALQRFGAGMNHGRLRILSFGCSSGLELMTLRVYFPSAMIFGCDLMSTDRFHKRSHAGKAARYFESSPENISQHGPYDMIFAMSVLCRQPLENPIAKDFPFPLFESLVEILHRNLKPGGLLAIYNSNYLFRELPYADSYRPVQSALIPSNGWVSKWRKDGTALEPPYASDADYIDCLFEKRPGTARYVRMGVRRPLFVRHVQSRTHTRTCKASGRCITLTQKLFVDLLGKYWVEREWSVPSVTGGVRQLGSWWEPASRDLLDPEIPPIPPPY
jgi:SAM-dependent methyltransferase